MKTKENFSGIENQAILFACTFIRETLFTSATRVLLSENPGNNSLKVAEDMAPDIQALVRDQKWEKLFVDDVWLNALTAAQNLSHFNQEIKESIGVIQKYFSKETTPAYLMPVF